ncbi:hypothetical protein [Chryseobacterium flavum]|uniref:hypothetical protein n=1 Tax=Chryseobacterium flavum TaxID=415851 RepID=UPI0028ABE356|nr:hypothetical protein [Chryseobacterium flavum]
MNDTIEEVLLTEKEKRRLMKILIWRFFIFFFMIIPVLAGCSYIAFLAAISFIEGKWDLWSFIVLFMYFIFLLLANKYIFVFYKNAFRYRNITSKQIIRTNVLHIKQKYSSSMKFQFEIQTDYTTVDTSKDVIIFKDVDFFSLQEGSTIYLHILPGVKSEFLRITDDLIK